LEPRNFEKRVWGGNRNLLVLERKSDPEAPVKEQNYPSDNYAINSFRKKTPKAMHRTSKN